MQLPVSTPTPREEYQRNEMEQLLGQVLNQLSPEDRQILLLKETEDYSYQQIADLLDIPIGTVMSRLYYARDRLRKKLKRYPIPDAM